MPAFGIGHNEAAPQLTTSLNVAPSSDLKDVVLRRTPRLKAWGALVSIILPRITPVCIASLNSLTAMATGLPFQANT